MGAHALKHFIAFEFDSLSVKGGRDATFVLLLIVILLLLLFFRSVPVNCVVLCSCYMLSGTCITHQIKVHSHAYSWVWLYNFICIDIYIFIILYPIFVCTMKTGNSQVRGENNGKNPNHRLESTERKINDGITTAVLRSLSFFESLPLSLSLSYYLSTMSSVKVFKKNQLQ